MSNRNSNPFTNDWLESQRQILDMWTAFGQIMTDTNPVKGDNKKKNPMDDTMASWWKLMAPALPEGSTEFITKMMGQGKFFNLLGEQFTQLLNNLNETNTASGDWQKLLNSQFEQLKKIYTSNQHDTNEVMHNMFGAWQLLPMDTFQRTLSTASVMPGDFLEDIKPDVLQKVTDKFLSIPGVGYTRETQEQIQEGIKLWNEYQKTCHEYNTAMNKVGINALESMRQKIISMAGEGKDIHSLREIYDIWVDCNEDAYADYVFSDEFSALYGRLTNALMAVKHHGRNYVDEILGAFNMPTRRGMSTIQKRQQEIRREQKVTEKLMHELQQEVAALRKQLAGDSSTVVKKYTGSVTKPAKRSESAKEAGKKKDRKKTSARKKQAKVKTAKKSSKKGDTIIINI